MVKPSWAKWMGSWPIVAPKIGPRQSPKERVLSIIDLLNAVRTRLNPFEEPISEISQENWPVLIEELYRKLRPCPPEQLDLEKFLKRARKRKRPSLEVKFDLPGLYGAASDGTPTQLATFRLIAALHWTVASLSEEIQDRPRSVCSLINEHFARLREHPLVRIEWVLNNGHPQPELMVTATGVDTQSWLVLLDFFKATPNWREVIGKCPQCLRLFEKPRRDAKYCGDACADKARYERWKARGGLRERKRKRLAKESNKTSV
jgi:hypothetical protein